MLSRVFDLSPARLIFVDLVLDTNYFFFSKKRRKRRPLVARTSNDPDIVLP